MPGVARSVRVAGGEEWALRQGRKGLVAAITKDFTNHCRELDLAPSEMGSPWRGSEPNNGLI